MGILTVIIDTKGASIPYLEIMENLAFEGIDGLTYVTDDLRSYVENVNVPTIVDRFNLAQFSAGNAAYESADNVFALLMGGRQISSGWTPSAMRTIAAAADAGQFIPEETVVISTTPGFLLVGHFLLELGVKSFICLEPYRFIDWMDVWQQDHSQFAPKALPKNMAMPLFRTMLGSIGKQKADEFFGRNIPYNYTDIKAAVKKQMYMYSPQVAADQHLAYGYPYPANGRIGSDLADFIAHQRQQGNRIIALTIGSMAVGPSKKAQIIEEFMAGVHELGDAAGIVLGYEPVADPAFFSTLDFVSYTALFPQIDLIVTHGGAGTTHMALFSGTPVLNMPFLKDQFDWAMRVEKLGMQVGMIPQKEFTATRFAATVKQNLTDTLIATARQVGEAERNHYNNPRPLLDEIIKVVATTRSYENRV